MNVQDVWLNALMFALCGYALLGRAFAYLFIGEMVLVVGFLLFLPTGRFFLLFSDPVLMLWAAFAFWGICRTVPFLGEYRFDAVRDAVLWGYGFFAVLIAAFISNSQQISRLLNSYRKFLYWYLILVPGLLLASLFLRSSLPSLPWGQQIAIISLRAGETSVHLAASALFLLMFSDRQANTRNSGISIFRLIGFIGWSLTVGVILIVSRGGLLAIALPVALASFLRVRLVGWKVAALAIAAALLVVIVLSADIITVKIHQRTFSSEQVSKNVASIFGNGPKSGTDDTKRWRLVWWTKIVRYTVFGEYRWTGKGFGVNLAQEDGPPGISKEDTSLRSPHNGNMTVLARMGVPGILLWIALNGVFAFRVYRAFRRSRSKFWAGVNLWILCIWLAALVELSFDVYIEGPDGGILFWTIIGFGVAALRVQRFEARQARAYARLRSLEPDESEYAAASA